MRRDLAYFLPVFCRVNPAGSSLLCQIRKSRVIYASLYRVARQCDTILMQSTEKKIKLIRDKLSRIGIGEKNLDDETILTSYSINSCGNLCSVQKSH